MGYAGIMSVTDPRDVVRCRRCHRKLRNEDTRLAGIGTTCARKEALEDAAAERLGPGHQTAAGYQRSYVAKDGSVAIHWGPTTNDAVG